MLIDKTTNIKLDGVEVSRILDAFGTVLYEHQSVPPKFLTVRLNDLLIEYGYDDYPSEKHIQIDGGESIYLTEPLYLDVTYANTIECLDTESKGIVWQLNNDAFVAGRTLTITQDMLNEGDNLLEVVSFY